MDGTKECRCIAKTPTKVGVFACYSFCMSEELGPERMKVAIEEWKPGSEGDQKFFEGIVPEMRVLKTRHLKDLFSAAPVSDEYVETRLAYLERRLHALKPGDVVYLGRIGNRLVGFILVRWDEEEKRTKLEQFYVEPEERSQGVGTNVLKKAFEYARQTHPDISQGIFLSTGKGEENRARQLYERMGFHVSSLPGDLPNEDRFDLDFGTEQKSV